MSETSKTVEKWVAWISWSQKLQVVKVDAVETKLQFRVQGNGPAAQGLSYRTVIPKSEDCILCDTKIEALQRLQRRLERTKKDAVDKVSNANQLLQLANDALRKAQPATP